MPDKNPGHFHSLTKGKEYKFIEKQPGIFPDQPFTIVEDENGVRFSAHSYRFEEAK